VFERFDEQGREVVVLALDEARSLGHDHIGSEHLLLGLLRLDDDLVEVFGEPDDVRRRVVEIVGEGELAPEGQLPFTPNGKRSLELAVTEADGALVGPWQLALALLRLPEDAGAVRTLRAQGISPDAARGQILGLRRQTADEEENRGLSPAALRVLATAARHAEDVPVGAEHILLALVLEIPDLAARTIGIADGGIVQERLARLLDGPERPRAKTGGRDIAILESALRNAQASGSEQVTPVHLLLGLLEVAPDVVARAAVDLASMEAGIRAWRVADDEPTSLIHRFAPAAREAVGRAADEARLLDHAYVGTEHLLLGLIRDEYGAAGRVLADLHVGLGEARVHVERIVGRGEVPLAPGVHLPFTARAKRVLQLALRESFRGSEIDTGHLLLAIERDGEGVAVLVLERLGATRGLMRRSTLAMLGHEPMEAVAPHAAPGIVGAYACAEEEAAALGQAWVGCEHLLLGVIRRGGQVAAALAGLGVTLDSVLWGVIDLGVIQGPRPFRTARLVRTLRTAERRAADAGRPQPDERDLILALARESVGAAHELLGRAADEASLRRALREP
jgi:ATP-dependent Clp protease ATP-binding subunit ClpA